MGNVLSKLKYPISDENEELDIKQNNNENNDNENNKYNEIKDINFEMINDNK